jgi:hypothetical protein
MERPDYTLVLLASLIRRGCTCSPLYHRRQTIRTRQQNGRHVRLQAGRASPSCTPDRMNFDNVVLRVVKVVHVATGLLHQDAPDQFASCAPVMLATTWRGSDLAQYLVELRDEEFLRVTMVAPPASSASNRCRASSSRTIFTTRSIPLQELPRVHPSACVRVVQRSIQGGVQFGALFSSQLVVNHQDFDFRALWQVCRLIQDQSPVLHLNPASVHARIVSRNAPPVGARDFRWRTRPPRCSPPCGRGGAVREAMLRVEYLHSESTGSSESIFFEISEVFTPALIGGSATALRVGIRDGIRDSGLGLAIRDQGLAMRDFVVPVRGFEPRFRG